MWNIQYTGLGFWPSYFHKGCNRVPSNPPWIYLGILEETNLEILTSQHPGWEICFTIWQNIIGISDIGLSKTL